jgi:radical SAM protein with 4Fe4S-binding SPASM domain
MKDMKAFGTESKFLTQISYDGQPIHDLKRRRVGGQSTSEDVLKGIQWAITSEIPFTLKSTITIDTFKHLYEAYRDFNALVGTNKFMYGQGYFPTVDYFNDVVGGDETLNGYIEDLKANMKQIAAFMIQERRAGRNPIDFSWFGDNRADCVAGVNLFSVDIDGRIFVCHGCFYTSKKEDHYVGRVTDDINVLKISQEKHGPYVHKNPAECATCEATFCVRCNTVRYSVSEKPTYEERWKDYTNNPNLCRIYKEAGKISRAFRKIMEGVTL